MKKITIISITAFLLLASVSIFIIWKINDEKEKREIAILADISNIQDNVNSLYKDEHKMNLADNIDNNMIKRTHDLFLNYKNKELSPQASTLLNQASLDINYVDKMFSLKQSIDNIFDKNGAIIESSDIESYKNQLVALKSEKPSFVDELMIKINDAETQKEQISTATKMTDALFTSSEKSTVKESITRTEIDDVKAKINNIKQDKAKTNLLSYVQIADVYLDAKLKAAAEAKAKVEAEAKAKAVAEVKNNNSEKSPSPSQKSNDTLDLTGWAIFDTGDLATLLKYLASGDVIKYNGQYWASPELINMYSNEEIVYEHDVSND